MFRRVAILGTGLIGGSFGHALRLAAPQAWRVGWDKPGRINAAASRGAVDQVSARLTDVLRGADLVYIALPVCTAMKLLPRIAAAAEPGALVTDACSTKSAICAQAKQLFKHGAMFLGGHPLAGRERGGIENADGTLFDGAPYILAEKKRPRDPRARKFVKLLRAIGAQPQWMDAAAHDRTLAWLSHAPQLVVTALAAVIEKRRKHGAVPLRLVGSGLRDSLRLAGSPAEMWQDICRTNSREIVPALDELLRILRRMRARARTGDLRAEFAAANSLYNAIGKRQ